jgi:hypothetical protein
MTSSGCDKNWLLNTAILFLFLWGYDFVVHGNLLMDMYVQTKDLWRPQADMESLYGWCLAGTAAMAFVFSSIYNCWTSKCDGGGTCAKAGANFGLWVGLLLGIMQAKSYIWLAIPGKLAVLWLIVETIKWGLAGILLAKLHGLNK